MREHDLRVGCKEEFMYTYPRPPLVDVCFHHMAVQSKLSQIIDLCIRHDNPYKLIMDKATSARQVLNAATMILHKNFGEDNMEDSAIFVDEGECDLCATEGAYLIDGELYCARCLNASIPVEDLFEEEYSDEDEDEDY